MSIIAGTANHETTKDHNIDNMRFSIFTIFLFVSQVIRIWPRNQNEPSIAQNLNFDLQIFP